MENQIDQQKQDNKTGNILCFISLGLMFVVPGIAGGIANAISSGDISSINNEISTVFSILSGSSIIAAWILAIVARVRYKNTMSKVLIILYAGLMVVMIIFVVIIVAACASCASGHSF